MTRSTLVGMSRHAKVAWMIPAILSLCCGGRAHVQEEGTYFIALTEVIRDECDLKATLGTSWTGAFQVAGNRTWLQMTDDLFGIQLVGFFLANLEQFTLDGTIGKVTSRASGRDCSLDLVASHMDGTTDHLKQFHGTVRVRYEAIQPSCICQLWARYQAVHQ